MRRFESGLDKETRRWALSIVDDLEELFDKEGTSRLPLPPLPEFVPFFTFRKLLCYCGA